MSHSESFFPQNEPQLRQEVIQLAKDSTFSLSIRNPGLFRYGSAVHIGNGNFLTAGHLFPYARTDNRNTKIPLTAELTNPLGDTQKFSVESIHQFFPVGLDLALLTSPEASDFPHVGIAADTKQKKAFTLYRQGRDIHVDKGALLVLKKALDRYGELIKAGRSQIIARVDGNPSASMFSIGAGIFNPAGELLGITTDRITTPGRQNLLIGAQLQNFI